MARGVGLWIIIFFWIFPEFGTEDEFYDLLISILSEPLNKLKFLLFAGFAEARDNFAVRRNC